jgi:outer membrane protein
MAVFITSTGKMEFAEMRAVCIENNISVKQADLQTRFSDVTYKQSKSAQYPSLNFQNSTGYRFGRSENPATGVLEDNNFLSSSFSLQSGSYFIQLVFQKEYY